MSDRAIPSDRRFGPMTGQVRTLSQRVRDLLPYSFMRADQYVDDGASAVRSFTDLVYPGTGIRAVTASHIFDQSVAGSRVAIPAADSAFKDALVAQMVTGKYYISNAPPSAWNVLHNGNGCDVFIGFKSLATPASIAPILSTGTYSGGTNGALIGVGTSAGNQMCRFQVRGAAATVINVAQTTYFSVGNATYGRWQYKEGQAPTEYYTYEKQTLIATNNSSTSPSSGDADGTLRINLTVTGGNYGNSALASFIIFNRILNAGELAVVQAYFAGDYGLT